jgi:phage N-6-adenine-methyltransferase
MSNIHKARGPADKDNWRTPKWLIEGIQKAWPITYDATAGLKGENCAYGLQPIPGNALMEEWDSAKIFANPPFDCQSLLTYALKFESADWTPYNGGILLCPQKTEQEWFQVAWRDGVMIPIRGRVNYIDPMLEWEMTGVPFGSVLFAFGYARQHVLAIKEAVDQARADNH